jgi:signal peptidase II
MPPQFEPAGAVDPAGAAASPEPHAESAQGFHLFWWLSAGVLAIDQIAKALIVWKLPEGESVAVIPGFMDFTHVRNAGVAFGILNNSDSFLASHKWAVTTALAAMALLGIGLYARYIRREEWLARIGLSLILGGAIGNLVDRVHFHNVVDFVDVYFRGWHFWAFNVADASITIGAVLVFLDLLFVTRRVPHASDSV